MLHENITNPTLYITEDTKNTIPFWQTWEWPKKESGGYFEIENPRTELRLTHDSVEKSTILVEEGENFQVTIIVKDTNTANQKMHALLKHKH